nr:bifunctional diaminohydroxyphosphoribosylaminopyrimidine deaminase/5-amino-6-(5-phosphoribosylamino)uracil reductase RibD [uncultured Roseateles sp.]
MSAPQHHHHHQSALSAMQHALSLAEQAVGLTEPNPRVGCVIVDAQGLVLGTGHTQAAGQAHAEVMALRDAQARGADVRGATAYVTLEPCSHQGRTGPCCDALIQAGLAKVVAAIGDPNPQVAGQGMARLAAAGVQTELGLLAEQARELNIGFFSRMQRGRPFVRLKIAASLDGQTALANGQSQWITGLPARTDGHAWRKRAGAVLSGIGTVREDDPRLDVRLVPCAMQPLRVVIDSRLEMSPGAKLLSEPGGPVLIFCALEEAQLNGDGPAAASAAALRAAGAKLQSIGNGQGKVDLSAALHELGRRGINELHIEAGEKLNGSLLRAGLVDELLVYLAPKLLGRGRGMADLGGLTQLQDALNWQWLDCVPVGDDLRLRARRAPTEAKL